MVERMPAGYQALTEKEKQTLRLVVRGHDAKSMARHLGLSVHTVNERLRDARRKLEVSSSRQAARLLLDTEGEDPQKIADKPLGDAAGAAAAAQADLPDSGKVRAPRVASPVAWLIAGVAIMSVIFGILALAAAPQSAPQSAGAAAPSEASAAGPVAETEAMRAARDWLALHDEGRWRESWSATAESFRTLNSVERWTEVAQQVRPPLGAVISRTAIGAERVPAPPAGVHVVKFRTRFANKADAVETVSLAREDGAWKVVGIYID
jgi:DNA-binding CsgD family transcriptional regulator